jgi:hypothetical protein
MIEQIVQVGVRLHGIGTAGSCRAPDYAERSCLEPVSKDWRFFSCGIV